jgi:hypothetical protein
MADKKIISIDIKVSERNASKAINTTKKAVDGLADSTERLSRANNKNRAQSGLNNAILIESGRVASDAAYGIQGMANNIGRIIELGQEFARTNKDKGMGGALRDLRRSFFGVGGILIGVQLLLSFLPKIMKAFESAGAKAKRFNEELEKIGEETEQTRQGLEAYFTVLNDYNLSQERRSNLEQQLIDKLPDIEKLNSKSKDGIDKLRESIELYIKQQEIRAEIDLLIEENAEGFIEDRQRRAVLEQLRLEKDQDKQVAIIKKNTNILQRLAIEAMGADGKGLIARLIEGDRYDTTDLIKGFEEFVNKEGGGVAAARKRIADLTAELIEYDKSTGKSSKSLRTFKQQFLDFDKDVEKLRQESLEQFVRDQETKIAKESTDLMMMFRIRTDDFKQRQKQRLDEFLESKATDKEKAKARIEYNESIALAEQELSNVLIAIESRAESKRTEFRLKRTQGVLETLYKIQQAEQDLADAQLMIPKKFTENSIKQRMKQLEFEIELQRGLVDAYEKGTQERADAELKLAQLQKNLADETVSYQRQRFNQIKEIYTQGADTIGFISEAIKNKEIKDAGDSEEAREEAAKRAWKVEKALKISRVIMDTYQQGYLAYGSQLVIGDPTSPIRAQIAQALTIAKGVAQVAAISSTQFDSKSVRGGEKGDIDVEAPDFNVVGASPESQLAQSVSAQQDKPVRAFVVHKDIRDANDQFNNIITSATFSS